MLADAGVETRLVGDVSDTGPRHRALLAWLLCDSVTNIVRHAGAGTVVIELGQRGMSITDDGSGLTGREGNGLRGMQAHRRRRRHVDGPRRRAGHPGRGGAAVIRILLADDQALVRGAPAALLDLDSDIELVAQVGRGDEVVDAARASVAEVCLLDIEMPGLTGSEAAAALRAKQVLPQIRATSSKTDGRRGLRPRPSPARQSRVGERIG